MPRTFDLKTRKNSTPSGTSNPCGVCRRQFAQYTCPACNLQYCSLVCYRTESHARCTEAFYKASLADQIRGEPGRTTEEKRQMLELLKRFEENATEEIEEDEGEGDDLVSRLKGIDLDSINHDALWELLTEDEKQKFLKAVENPNTEGSKLLLDAQELVEKPWWDPSAAREDTPVVRPVPEKMLKSAQFNPALLFNVFHTSLSYAFTLRTFGIPALSRQPLDDVEAVQNTIISLSPFLSDRKSTLVFTSIDSVITDWTSHLSEYPQAALTRLLLADAQVIFRPQHVVDSQASIHEPCMRFVSDVIAVFDHSKKHSHIVHKLTFYLAMISNLATDASADLIKAIRVWEAKNCDDTNVEKAEHPARREPLIEELP